MAELTRVARISLPANRTRTYGPLAVPNAGYTRVRISIDLSNADQLDPTAFVKFTIEASRDAGTTWGLVAEATTYGSTAPERQAMLSDPEASRPWIQFACPPSGALLRATVATAAKALDIGFIVEAW